MSDTNTKLIEKDLPDAVLIGALFLHLLIMLKFPNLAWADEVMQTLEQGHRWAFGYGIVPWEFRDGVRSWVLPGFFGLVMRATAPLGSGSGPYLMAVHIVLAACSLPPIAAAMAWAKRAQLRHAWAAGAAMAIWFELVYFSGKALTEVFAAWALPVALYFSMRAREDNDRRAALWAGLAWGFTVGFRVHLAPAALVAMIYTARRDRQRWVPLLGGAAAVVTAFGLLDWITWSYPFQSFIANFYVNVVKGKAAWFGVSPWWDYFSSLAKVWQWSAIPLLALAYVGFRRWPILPLTAATILLAHSAISHKEYRFIVPFIAVVLLGAGLGLAQLLSERRELGFIAGLALLLASADGARRFDWNDLNPRERTRAAHEPLWSFRDGAIQAFSSMSTDTTACGVGIAGIGWGWSGGYTYLHRNVPLWDLRNNAEIAAAKPFANVLIAAGENGDHIDDYKRGECFGSQPPICIYTRTGTCEPPGAYSLNAYLAQTGM